MEDAIRETGKAFATAHKNDEDRQTDISASRHTLSVIAKAEAWQATCSAHSLKLVYSLLHFVAGFFSFPDCLYPREPASVYPTS